jgi:hypothetical protein
MGSQAGPQSRLDLQTAVPGPYWHARRQTRSHMAPETISFTGKLGMWGRTTTPDMHLGCTCTQRTHEQVYMHEAGDHKHNIKQHEPNMHVLNTRHELPQYWNGSTISLVSMLMVILNSLVRTSPNPRLKAWNEPRSKNKSTG